MIPVFDDPFPGVAEVVAFGNPWHGYEQGGDLYTPAGALITLPEGQSYFRAADGGNHLIDLGMPPVTTTPAETALGITWSNKAVLAGSGIGGALSIYNPVRGSSAPGLNFRSMSFPYRCADGTVYLLWVSPDKMIRAELMSFPAASGSIPANTTGGTIRLDLSAVLRTQRVVGSQTYALYRWLNFAPNGTKAAIHGAYVSGTQQVVYQITEVAVAGGDAATLPTVTLTQSRSLDAGEGLLVDFTQAPTYGVYQGPNDLFPVTRPSGDDISRTTKVYFVDYDKTSDRVEIGEKLNVVNTHTPYINGAGNSDSSMVGQSKYEIMRNGSTACVVWDLEIYEASLSSDSPTVITRADPYPANGEVTVINGNLAVLSNPRVTYASGGVYSGSVSIFGLVGANATTGDGKSSIATGVDPLNISVHPESGLFTVGRTRYF